MLKKTTIQAVDTLIRRYPTLAAMKENLLQAVDILIETYRKGGKLILCGNGSLYCGISNRPQERFAAHLAGKGAKYTRLNKPAAMR